jgi:membrane-associated phospholipid phosphatase
MRPSNTKPQVEYTMRFSIDAVPHPSTPGEHIAYWISHLGSPPAVGVYAAFFTAVSIPAAPWLWVGVFIFLSLVAPLLFLIWQLRRGDVTDIEIHFRQQRKWALLVTIAGFAITWIAMLVGNAPPILRLLVGTGLVEWSVIFVVTLRWKISIHAASISGMVAYLVWGFGMIAAPALLAIPVVGWSRVKLRHHTPAQVLAGIGLGGLSFAAALVCSPYLIAPGQLTP